MTFRCGMVTVRKPRTCGNGHPILPGDTIRQWVGIVDGEFSPWEECARCVELGWDHFRRMPAPTRGPGHGEAVTTR